MPQCLRYLKYRGRVVRKSRLRCSTNIEALQFAIFSLFVTPRFGVDIQCSVFLLEAAFNTNKIFCFD
ncbi:hypothetical protein ACET3Z_023810 [Daucus carota]